MKILNLFSGLGGNRALWGNSHTITAVESNSEIAREYSRLFPSDTVIVADAHVFLLDHLFDGWDFIWASPPCLTHSRLNAGLTRSPRYPDMSLYQVIILLKSHWFKGKWVVENVVPYYEPLIRPNLIIGRHFFWCNFFLGGYNPKAFASLKGQIRSNARFGFDLKGIKLQANKRQVIRNLVDPELGLLFFNRVLDMTLNKEHILQGVLFAANM